MKLMELTHNEGVKKIAEMLRDGKLFPIFGAGFTMGSKMHDKRNRVPGGVETTKLMNDLLKANNVYDFLLSDDFNETAKLFLDEIDQNSRKDFFRLHFTNVILEDNKKTFLQLPWDYAYTINVDDGIERNSDFNALLPYKNARTESLPSKPLFKLHGDALQEANYIEEGENIVFSATQYMSSLTSEENKTVINALKGDYRSKNLLFIGCSLIKEPDLEFIYDVIKTDVPEGNMRMLIRTNSLSEKEKYNISRKFGVNTFITVSDYDLFYREVVTEYEKIKSKEHYPFQNPKIINCIDRKDNEKYFLAHNIFDDKNNSFMKTNLHILRDCINKIEEELNESHCLVLQGRRFSGKTFIMLNLLERYSSLKTYYFPSNTAQDENIVTELIRNSIDSIFLFDSNSLVRNAYEYVANSQERIKSNRNKIVVAVNSSDSYFSENINAKIILIQNRFSHSENNRIMPILDRYSWIRRQDGWTNIDYLVKLKNSVGKLNVDILNAPDTNSFSLNDKVLLYVLCVRDKVFYSETVALDISIKDIESLKTRMRGIVETVPVTKGERGYHCVEKLVCNSKLMALSIVKKFELDAVLEIIKKLATKLAKDRSNRRLYIECILFDTLNQVFDDEERGLDSPIHNTSALIFEIYKLLEEYVSDDMDYWLQRAKSIYRLKSKDRDALLDAYSYASKAYHDGHTNLKSRASLTLSRICCYLSYLKNIDSYTQSAYEREAIDMFIYALDKDSINLMRENDYFREIRKVCEKYKRHDDRNLRDKVSKILSRLKISNYENR